jgi:rubredoxin
VIHNIVKRVLGSLAVPNTTGTMGKHFYEIDEPAENPLLEHLDRIEKIKPTEWSTRTITRYKALPPGKSRCCPECESYRPAYRRMRYTPTMHECTNSWHDPYCPECGSAKSDLKLTSLETAVVCDNDWHNRYD